ncbi:MAG: TolC family protein [Methylacidiphilales bacterium]|nr:TolC family protein [Candidatus Methylacidiphilales bacterium]
MDTGPVSIPDVPGTELTWEDCVRLATANNPALQSSREAVLNSDAVRMGAYSALYPQISASFSGNRSYSGPGLYSENNYSTSYTEQLSLSQTIFNGFATKGNIDQARAQLNLALASLDEEKASTSYNVKTAFANLIYAQKLMTISRDVVDIREKAARLVRLLYEGGSEDKGNMLLEQAELDQAVYNLNQAERNLDLSSVQLMEMIGKELPQPLVAEGELKTNPLTATPDFKQLAVQTPTYFQQRAEVDASAAGITIADSGWYPTITATAAAMRSDTQFPLKVNGWSAGFAVSYPIFQGGQTYFNVKAANAALRESLQNLRSGTDQSVSTLAGDFKGLVDSADNVRIQDELLEATALRYKIAEQDYRNGLMSFEDFDTITGNYVSQQEAYLSAELSAVLAEAAWEEARGLGAIP